MMKASEIRELSAEELNAKLGDLKKDLFNLRLQHAVNQLDNPNKIVEVKRDIARIKTIIRERELAARSFRTKWIRPSWLRSKTEYSIRCIKSSSIERIN